MKNEENQKGLLSPEITKLSERLAKDPTSKLFVPLAEEYIKAGMLEEAVAVLMDGLKAHPGFTSAHVTLGKVYLGKGQIKEAKEQFETVIKVSPDNLLAHRKLVKIYQEEGAIQQAIQSTQVILSSNPKDEEMKKILSELASRQKNVSSSQGPEPEAFSSLQAGTIERTSASVQPPPPPQASAEESRIHDQSSVRLEVPSRTDEGIFDKEKQGVADSPPREEGEAAGRVLELEEPEGSMEEILTLMGQEGKVETVSKTSEEVLATESLADLYIKQGFFDKGIEIYQALFSKDPENKAALKKLKDAIALSRTSPKMPSETEGAADEEPAPVKTPKKSETAAVTEEIPVEVSPQPSSVTPLSPRQSKAGKIQKLQSWLEQVKRSRKQ